MIIAALVRLFKKIKPNTKMSKAAAKIVPAAKKYEYEEATFIRLTDDSIILSYTYDGKTATTTHKLQPNQNKIFKEQIYNVHFDKKSKKIKTGKIFAAINKKKGVIEYLFWESPKNGKDGKKEKIYF